MLTSGWKWTLDGLDHFFFIDNPESLCKETVLICRPKTLSATGTKYCEKCLNKHKQRYGGKNYIIKSEWTVDGIDREITTKEK